MQVALAVCQDRCPCGGRGPHAWSGGAKGRTSSLIVTKTDALDAVDQGSSSKNATEVIPEEGRHLRALGCTRLGRRACEPFIQWQSYPSLPHSRHRALPGQVSIVSSRRHHKPLPHRAHSLGRGLPDLLAILFSQSFPILLATGSFTSRIWWLFSAVTVARRLMPSEAAFSCSLVSCRPCVS